MNWGGRKQKRGRNAEDMHTPRSSGSQYLSEGLTLTIPRSQGEDHLGRTLLAEEKTNSLLGGTQLMMDQLCKTEGTRTPWLTDSENELLQAGQTTTVTSLLNTLWKSGRNSKCSVGGNKPCQKGEQEAHHFPKHLDWFYAGHCCSWTSCAPKAQGKQAEVTATVQLIGMAGGKNSLSSREWRNIRKISLGALTGTWVCCLLLPHRTLPQLGVPC